MQRVRKSTAASAANSWSCLSRGSASMLAAGAVMSSVWRKLFALLITVLAAWLPAISTFSGNSSSMWADSIAALMASLRLAAVGCEEGAEEWWNVLQHGLCLLVVCPHNGEQSNEVGLERHLGLGEGHCNLFNTVQRASCQEANDIDDDVDLVRLQAQAASLLALWVELGDELVHHSVGGGALLLVLEHARVNDGEERLEKCRARLHLLRVAEEVRHEHVELGPEEGTLGSAEHAGGQWEQKRVLALLRVRLQQAKECQNALVRRSVSAL
mmetsp:Transcript_18198/g.70341  ORF Transcript_18198/g.70341 Transcript_18198/m.70341 type:complete len:270 (-) Transcript_18198:29-838(-)